MRTTSPLRNPRLQALAALLILCATSFAAWWVYKYLPLQREIVQLRDTEARLLAANKSGRRSLALLGIDGVQAVLAQLDSQAVHVAALVPTEDQAMPIDREINAAQNTTGVVVSFSSPMPDTTDRGFIVRRTAYTVRGGYHDVGAFLTAILSLPRVTRISDLQLKSVPPGAEDRFAAGRPVEASFVFSAYLSRPTVSPSTPVVAGAAAGPAGAGQGSSSGGAPQPGAPSAAHPQTPPGGVELGPPVGLPGGHP